MVPSNKVIRYKKCTSQKSVTSGIPIIAVSALSDDHSIKEAYRYGVADYFIKPIDIEKLVNRIKQILKV